MLLNEVQARFKDLMLAHPDSVYALDDKFAAVFEEKQIPLPERLKVYRNNIVGSITDIVVATFPIIKELVGLDFLEATARAFILQNPPQQSNMNSYGVGFDEFLKTFEPAQSLPYLVDVARMEIAMNEAYYAEDEVAVSAEDFGTILPENLPEICVGIAKNAHILHFDYPVSVIRAYCLSDDQSEPLDVNSGGEKLLIQRPHIDVTITHISDSECEMLHNLSEHALGEAVELTLLKYPDFDFQAFLQKHLDLGTFVSLK